MAENRKTIVVTGATRGLGRALVEEFMTHGHRVFGCGRSEARLQPLREEAGASGDFQKVDVSDPQAVERWARQVLDLAGPPDLLVNNAAVINRNAKLWEVPAEEFSGVIDINIKGVVNVLRAFVPSMVDRKSGVIVNFSSAWGRSAAAEVAPYCATKWAIEGLTKALAEELPEGMAAIPLNPGIIDTDMLRSCFGGSAGSFPGPQAWAKRAAPFLLQLSARETGQSLNAPA